MFFNISGMRVPIYAAYDDVRLAYEFFFSKAPLKRTSSWSVDEKLLIQSLYKVVCYYLFFPRYL